jgi:hypothetical protein
MVDPLFIAEFDDGYRTCVAVFAICSRYLTNYELANHLSQGQGVASLWHSPFSLCLPLFPLGGDYTLNAVTSTAMTRKQPAAVRGINCTAGLVSLPPRHQHPQLRK